LAKAQSLSVEITEHLGHDKHDPASRDRGNSRNGARSKMELSVRRRRPSSPVADSHTWGNIDQVPVCLDSACAEPARIPLA
jgi:hypothetical protein